MNLILQAIKALFRKLENAVSNLSLTFGTRLDKVECDVKTAQDTAVKAVKTVNGVYPDESGNVNVEAETGPYLVEIFYDGDGWVMTTGTFQEIKEKLINRENIVFRMSASSGSGYIDSYHIGYVFYNDEESEIQMEVSNTSLQYQSGGIYTVNSYGRLAFISPDNTISMRNFWE